MRDVTTIAEFEDAPVREMSVLEHMSMSIFTSLSNNPNLGPIVLKNEQAVRSTIKQSVTIARLLLAEAAAKPEVKEEATTGEGTANADG